MRHRRHERPPSPTAPQVRRKGSSVRGPASRSVGGLPRRKKKRGGAQIRADPPSGGATPPRMSAQRAILSAPIQARIIDFAPARNLEALNVRASAAAAAANGWESSKIKRANSIKVGSGADVGASHPMNTFLVGAGLSGTSVYDLQALEAELTSARNLPEPQAAEESRGAYEERAKRLQGMLPAAVSAAAREAHRREVAAQTAMIAAEQAQARRPPRPKPTPLSDVDAVLGWLERRQLKMREAAGGGMTIDDEAEGSSIIGGLQRWKQRASGRGGGADTMHGGHAGSFAMVDDSGVLSPPPVDPFERQRQLVAEAGRDGTWSDHSEDLSEQSESSGDEEGSERRVATRTGGRGASSSAQKHLAELEQQKAEAKRRVVDAERGLRTQLGRKPTEGERHVDEAFQEALRRFKHASQVVFVANSVANWND